MTGTGIVVKTDFKTATVRIRKASACGHDCGECRVCTNPEFETEVINSVGARVGDRVIIGAPGSQVLFLAFSLYILPILGAVICYALSGVFFIEMPARALCTALWIVLWAVYIRRLGRRGVKMSRILEVADEEN